MRSRLVAAVDEQVKAVAAAIHGVSNSIHAWGWRKEDVGGVRYVYCGSAVVAISPVIDTRSRIRLGSANEG